MNFEHARYNMIEAADPPLDGALDQDVPSLAL